MGQTNSKFIIKFLEDFTLIIGEMAPYLLLGFFFAGLLYAFVPRQKIERYFSGNSFKAPVLASLFGVPLPLCSCGVIPTGTALYKNGASKGGTVSFLISTPQTGVDSILATFSLLGLPFAIMRPIAALLTGITGGVITGRLTQKEERTYTEEQAPEGVFLKQKIINALRYGFVDFIQDIAKWLVIGLLLAAVISALIPDDFFDLLNLPPYLQMLLILVASIPLYICATGTIPLAAILILKGISPGAAFVLLMAGPATNAATITMIGKVLGRKSLIIYLATIIIGALSFGLTIDYLLPVEWFAHITETHALHHHSQGLNWWQLASGIILVVLIINAFSQRHLSQKKKNNSHSQTAIIMKTITLNVEGMTCNHCKSNVEVNLEKLDSIDIACVNLADKTVKIEGHDIKVEEARDLINSIGYKCL